ncbi:allophanate hydrolase [Luteolibacter arcticus]|uniref:Allophanate hydrolase n=1 Tax=Luteolibacter arcticus TaxID=1581411 RepID=A0ABT3GLG7_9BACT|nr:allophanate hydrolase [Luteolibacter arcticus]MCW1924363.1 allophanate hydrolase [Luteolibacter arcticus]
MKIAELKKRYAEGLKPTELIEELWEKIAAWDDPALFIHLPEKDELLAMAEAVESMPGDLPLWGIPFVVKDNLDVEGMPTTAACPAFSYVPAVDAEVVNRLRAAGAIPLGKANLDQFATGLVGTRSPYGTPRNAIDAEFLPGGSSSGSASSVAAGLCCFSLGTDTAGSGRVPAAFQELIGWKPTKGLLSTRGVVPACRSLDCVSVFANTVEDVSLIAGVVAGFDEGDPFSREIEPVGKIGPAFRFGVPLELDFADDLDTPGLFAAAVERMKALGGEPVGIDLKPFVEAAKLLYEGPWVAERWAAVGGFVEENPGEIFPVTRKILEASKGWDAAATFRAQYRMAELARVAAKVWKDIEVLLLPTTPRIYTVAEVLDEPFQTNATLGKYTNFMNLLDLSAIAVPAGKARGGRARWGVTFAAPAGWDGELLKLAARFGGEAVNELPKPQRPAIPVVVCGAHLEGLALHWQLAERGATLRSRTRTAPVYRMYAMPAVGSIPPRPALIRDEEEGGAIEVEVWDLSPAAFGDFVSKIPGPLGIGKVLMENGEDLPGFIAEPRAADGAEEITGFGGWKAWLASKST